MAAGARYTLLGLQTLIKLLRLFLACRKYAINSTRKHKFGHNVVLDLIDRDKVLIKPISEYRVSIMNLHLIAENGFTPPFLRGLAKSLAKSPAKFWEGLPILYSCSMYIIVFTAS